MSGKNVKQTRKVVNKATVKIATAGINAYKVFLNNLGFRARIRAAVLIVLKRYK